MTRATQTISYDFAAIDFETANHSSDSACAVGISIVRQGRIAAQRTRLIRPPNGEFAFTHIHGLSWKDVRKEPTFSEVWADLYPELSDVRFFAAHNAPFDRKVLHACCKRYGLDQPRQKFVCTVQVARSVFDIRPTRLPDVCRHLNISLNHHEAGSDAEACARILLTAAGSGWHPPAPR